MKYVGEKQFFQIIGLKSANEHKLRVLKHFLIRSRGLASTELSLLVKFVNKYVKDDKLSD